VLRSLYNVVVNWVQNVFRRKFKAKDVDLNVGGALRISGSTKLGVNSHDADIDAICVVPNFCDQNDFFGAINPSTEEMADKQSYLLNYLTTIPGVENVKAVREAQVPIIMMKFNGIDIDLMLAILDCSRVDRDIDICNDEILKGVDSGSVRALSGVRDTQLVYDLVRTRVHTLYVECSNFEELSY
jgi:poly(A) polymerase